LTIFGYILKEWCNKRDFKPSLDWEPFHILGSLTGPQDGFCPEFWSRKFKRLKVYSKSKTSYKSQKWLLLIEWGTGNTEPISTIIFKNERAKMSSQFSREWTFLLKILFKKEPSKKIPSRISKQVLLAWFWIHASSLFKFQETLNFKKIDALHIGFSQYQNKID